MKSRLMVITAVSALVVLFTLSLSAGAKKAGNVAGARELSSIPSPTPAGPVYKAVSLGCSTGVLFTTVTNNSKTNIPAYATIIVTSQQGDCTQKAKGPLDKGKTMTFLGCREPVTTCGAGATWEISMEQEPKAPSRADRPATRHKRTRKN